MDRLGFASFNVAVAAAFLAGQGCGGRTDLALAGDDISYDSGGSGLLGSGGSGGKGGHGGGFADGGSFAVGGGFGAGGSFAVGGSTIGTGGGFGVGGTFGTGGTIGTAGTVGIGGRAGSFGMGGKGGGIGCGDCPADVCQSATCDFATGKCIVQSLPDGTGCTPEDLCQIGSCASGKCNGTDKDCSSTPLPNECYEPGCNGSTGKCEAQPISGNDCVDPTDLCTIDKSCVMGVCAGGVPKDCSDLDGACTVGECDPDTGDCVAVELPDGTACDDDDPCTAADTCSGDVCSGDAITECSDGDQCCPEGCLGADDSDCGATCADLLTNVNVWGITAKGFLLSAYTNGTLDWIGCPSNGCSPNSFYCTDLGNGIQFGTTESGAMRTVVDPGNARGDVLPTMIAPADTGCCSATYPWGVCNSLDPGSNGQSIDSTDALCRALGYQNGDILRQVNGNFCPQPHSLTTLGSDWTSDWKQDLNWIAEFKCSN